MNKIDKQIESSKFIRQLAQDVWAANKYFVLACSQVDYLAIRHHMNSDGDGLLQAYAVLENVIERYGGERNCQLPELTNSLYHMSGYFKKYLSNEERQKLDSLIRTNQQQALEEIEALVFQYNVTYLVMSLMWKENRAAIFNRNQKKMKYAGVFYEQNELIWQGDSVWIMTE